MDVSRFDKSAAEAALKYSAAPDENGGDTESIPIRAPVGGQVLRIHHESEGVVARGQPLVDIGDPDSLEVVVEVLSRDAVRIVPEMKVLLTRWGGDEALQGRVKTVEPVGFTKVSALGVEEQRVQVIVEIVTPRAQWARLGDGYRVEAAFLLWEADNVLQVPTSALFRVDQDWALFLAGDGRAVLQVVKPGQRSGISTQILAGIEAGQVLINHPGDNLEPGSPIRPR